MKVFLVLALVNIINGAKFNPKPSNGMRPCDFYRRSARVEFKGAVSGAIVFTSTSCGGKGVEMRGTLKVRNLKGEHKLNWHIHELGSITKQCDQTGPPFNPFNAPSGS